MNLHFSMYITEKYSITYVLHGSLEIKKIAIFIPENYMTNIDTNLFKTK